MKKEGLSFKVDTGAEETINEDSGGGPEPLSEVVKYLVDYAREHPVQAGFDALGLPQGYRAFTKTLGELFDEGRDMTAADFFAWGSAQLLTLYRAAYGQTSVEKDLNKGEKSMIAVAAKDVFVAASDGLDGGIIRGRDHVDGRLLGPDDENLVNILATVNNAKTDLGKFLDQWADKIARAIELIYMAKRGDVSWAFAVASISRDLAMNFVRGAVDFDTGGETDTAARDLPPPGKEEGSFLKYVWKAIEDGSGKLRTAFDLIAVKATKYIPGDKNSPDTIAIEVMSIAFAYHTLIKNAQAYATPAIRHKRSQGEGQLPDIDPIEDKAEPKQEPVFPEWWNQNREPENKVKRTGKATIKEIQHLNPTELIEMGVEAIFLDVDGTLLGIEEPGSSIKNDRDSDDNLRKTRRQEILKKLFELRQYGIKIVLISNTKRPKRLVEIIEGINEYAEERISGDSTAETNVIAGVVVPRSAVNLAGEEGVDGATREEWPKLVKRAGMVGCELVAGGRSKPHSDMFQIGSQIAGVELSKVASIGDQYLKEGVGAQLAGCLLQISCEPFGKDDPSVRDYQRPVERALGAFEHPFGKKHLRPLKEIVGGVASILMNPRPPAGIYSGKLEIIEEPILEVLNQTSESDNKVYC